MAQAALQIVRHGWPVFPCRERDGEPYSFTDKKSGQRVTKTPTAKQPYVGHGLKDATRDERRIEAWWRQHPDALIGVPMGVNGCFALDFDPRVEDVIDPETGEVTGTREYTLEELKAELEAMIGVPLPPSLTSITQSGGVHVWFRQPDDGGEPIRNRGNLPDHVDVRGLGGYVIAPPSVTRDSAGAEIGRYRWYGQRGDWRDPASVKAAPPELIEILRAPKRKAASAIDPEQALYAEARRLVQAERKASTSWLQRQLRIGYNSAARLIERMEADGIVSAPDAIGRREVLAAPSAPIGRDRAAIDGAVDEDVRKYALAALDGECRAVREAPSGRRNPQLNESAFKIASLVAAGALDGGIARASIEAAAAANPGRDDAGQIAATINSGWTAGSGNPRDLAEIAAASRSRRERGRNPSAPSRARAAPPPRAASQNDAPFQPGRVEGRSSLGEVEAARLKAVSAAWMTRRLEHVERERDAIVRLAFSIGRRIEAGLIADGDAKEALWAVYGDVADVQHADIDAAIEDGRTRGFDVEPLLLTMRCAGYPLTDFGIAERFRDRYGRDFRFTTAKGWLGWDGRRWKVLDQDEKTPPSEVIAAVFETVRAIQDEGRFIGDTGVKVTVADLPDGELFSARLNPHGMDRLIPKGKNFVLFSDTMKAFGRSSETTGKPSAVATLARRWLTLPIENFDRDPFAFNVMNGTLRFTRETLPDGSTTSAVVREDHCRDDMLTKLSPVEYDPDAVCPLYDGMFEWAQPDSTMRRYLHQLGGYGLTGDASEQKLWFWYGRGRNGKGVTIESWCYVAGDYSDTVPIASLLDQGIKKRGDQATPDLAKLAGVRMLRSSEPGRNEKLDTGLIKLVTGGEPFDVRMLHRGFFSLRPIFKLIISGNTKFDIPDTDDGIWGRLKLIPWLRNIEKPEAGVANWPEKDPHLVDKIKAREASGVLNRLVAGLLDYLANGLVEPQAVTEATSAYRDASDPLARFLRLCTVEEESGRVQSSRLYEVFVAWSKAAGEQGRHEWSNKGFSSAMTEKGYEKKQSNGVQWLGLRLVKEVHDFVDADGKVKTFGSDTEPEPDAAAPPYDDGPPL